MFCVRTPGRDRVSRLKKKKREGEREKKTAGKHGRSASRGRYLDKRKIEVKKCLSTVYKIFNKRHKTRQDIIDVNFDPGREAASRPRRLKMGGECCLPGNP